MKGGKGFMVFMVFSLPFDIGTKGGDNIPHSKDNKIMVPKKLIQNGPNFKKS